MHLSRTLLLCECVEHDLLFPIFTIFSHSLSHDAPLLGSPVIMLVQPGGVAGEQTEGTFSNSIGAWLATGEEVGGALFSPSAEWAPFSCRSKQKQGIELQMRSLDEHANAEGQIW